MNIKETFINDNILRFTLEGVDVSVANALRRIMIAEVPSMAIDEIYVAENTTPLFDEIIAHRLGLIPLTTDLDSYVPKDKCSCQGVGCSRCQVVLSLDKKAESEIITVYSGDLKSDDSKVTPVSPNIPITKMARGQKLTLEAYARLGTGKEHAKWEPVAACFYKYKPLIELDSEKCNLCGACVSECPKNIFKIVKNKIILEHPETCILCFECVNKCKTNAIRVAYDTNNIMFTVESTGALPPERIFLEALKIFDDKLTELRNIIAGKSEVDK
ncbi:MAG: DNA-directed RNA polymerase subunit D [Candidatus Odinarchaeum yellowstonii]|uniref:DNA-directed RNA polymerase subunit Rpo3 n=1 Tax=Odinarchaeota yellowstonii (strain LCB_4) TaxID=1841599 RepID=A0AAF0IAN8_ODILC|nr:MAG: DNA-directed RNA polymerase subunit D [Candidatus Odinarchaeum yellowstonii]